MSGYTHLSRLARLSATNNHQRSARRDPVRERASPDTPADYVCPSCGDESVAACECTRCEVPLVTRVDHVLVPRASARHSLPPGLVRAGLYVVETFAPQAAGKLHRRWAWRRAQSQLSSSAPVDIASLPVEVRAPMHVRGRLTVAPPNAEPRVAVADATGRAVLVLGTGVRVFDDVGERFALADGDEVDVLGVGCRMAGPARSYRDSHGDFAFDGSRAVQVWIRAPG